MFVNLLLKNKNVCKFLNCYDIIIPVPVHRKRRSERGYNQTELIAKELANNLRITYSSSSLIKDKNIKPLSSMGAKERKNQIKNVFKVKNIESIKGKKVVLFDDIYTTGSTYIECKRVLIETGAKEVGILTLARDAYKSTKERKK